MPKILIIRLSSIGDIVLTTPAIRCLKQQVPGCELHLLCKTKYSEILKTNPHLDKIHHFSGLAGCISELKKENFDTVVDLHANQRTFAIKWFLKPAVSLTVKKLSLRKLLLVWFKINTLPDSHVVDRYMAALAPLQVENDGLGLEYHLPEKDKVPVPEQFPEIGQEPYVAVVAGATHFTKRLPKEKLVNICELISRPVILLGGPDVVELGEYVTAKLGNGKRIANACGKLNLNQSASVMQQAERVVTHDTGLMHIAAALKKPIVSVWGATVPAFGMYPYYGSQPVNSMLAEVPDLPCRPCSKVGGGKCPKRHFNCMKLIDENQIADWVNGEGG